MEYVSIPPQQAIENIKKQHQKELEEKLNRLETFKDSEAVGELEDLYSQGLELVEPEEMSGSLKGTHQINQHMGTMFQDANESIKIVTSEKGLNALHDNHADLLQEARENGVNVQVLAPVTDDNRESFEGLRNVADVRHLQGNKFDVPNGRFAIIDNDALTMSMTHDDVHQTQDTAFWSKSDHMAENMMEPVFDMLWKHAGEGRQEGAPKGPNGPE